MTKEIWKDIKGYEGHYQISNLGRVKSLARKGLRDKGIYNDIILKQQTTYKGYKNIMLLKNKVRKTRMVHRLVAQAFIPNLLNKPQINHIDGVKTNNNVNNLEWATNSENQLHANRMGLNENRIRQTIKAKSKPVIQYSLDGKEIARFYNARIAEKHTGISFKTISYYCTKKPKNLSAKYNCYFRFEKEE